MRGLRPRLVLADRSGGAPHPSTGVGLRSFRPEGRHPTHMCAYTPGMTSRQNSQTVPPPLVVLDALAYCDGPAAHEARIISDGTTAVAHLTGPPHLDVAVCRDGVMLTGECPASHQDGPCPGTLSWSLSTEGGWTAHHESITLLTTYGEQVER